jgi:hypothetical protein
MSKVFVLDTNKQPLNPVHPGRARLLLSTGKAAVLKYCPFTIILKAAVDEPMLELLRVKLDPGSRTTGIALLNEATGEVVFAAELTHRGQSIKEALGGTPGQKAAPYQIQKTALPESQTEEGLASPLVGKPSLQRGHVG